MTNPLREAALDYHRQPTHGKISVVPTKPMATQRDLSLAYSPGVAEACNAIAADPGQAHSLTARGNLVAVVTNGTAVLGLGSIGPLAGKPVMEGTACLFKKFAGIDVFDIEVNERDPAPRSSPRLRSSTRCAAWARPSIGRNWSAPGPERPRWPAWTC